MRILLEYPGIDVNKPALGDRNYSPLHYAVEMATSQDSDMVRWLLAKEGIEVDAKSNMEETPLELAIRTRQALSAQCLLFHTKTSDEVRLTYLEEAICEEDNILQDVVGEVLEHVKDESLMGEKLEDLLNAAQLTREPKKEPLFRLIMTRAIRLGVWKNMPNPYHRAVKVESIEIVKLLTAAGGGPAQLDQDNWSCLDYANGRKCSPGFISALQDHVNDKKKLEPKSATRVFKQPTKLQEVPNDLPVTITVSDCATAEHDDCTGVQGQCTPSHCPYPCYIRQSRITINFAQ